MAARGTGGAQLPLQLLEPGIGRRPRLAATLLPLTVGIVDAGPEPQAPLQSLTGGRIADAGRQLLIQQRRHQPPGLGGSGLLQGPLDDGIPLLQGQLAGQPGGTTPAGGAEHPGLTTGEQHNSRLRRQLEALEMIRQQIEADTAGTLGTVG